MEEEIVQALSAMAHTTRLRIVRRLVQAGCGGATPSWLAEELGVSPTALSFHLKELTHAGLVVKRRHGRAVRYGADLARMTTLITFLTAECCTRPQPASYAAQTKSADAKSAETTTAWETAS